MDVKELQSAGLYDPGAKDADKRLALLQFNLEQGVTIEEMVAADKEGRLAFVAGERLLWGGEKRISLSEVAARTGQPVEVLAKMWRASGFADPDPDTPFFTESAVEVLSLFHMSNQIYGSDVTLQLARVIGSSLARIAEAAVSAFATNIGAPLIEANDELALARANVEVASLLPQLTRALDIGHRYHVEAAIRRVGLVPENGHSPVSKQLAVGFTDLVGFTTLSQQLSPRELAGAVADFEAEASDLITARAGRVVKLIGDEVMFVAPDAVAGCDIALSLVERFSGHDVLPPLRGGLAAGPMLTQDGDYYGPVVNLAARAARLARPGTVLVPRELKRQAEALSSDFTFRSLGPRRVKGFRDRVRLYALRRARKSNVDVSEMELSSPTGR